MSGHNPHLPSYAASQQRPSPSPPGLLPIPGDAAAYEAALFQLQSELQQVRQQVAAQSSVGSGHGAAPTAVAHAPRVERPRIPAPPVYEGKAAALDDWFNELERQFSWYGMHQPCDRIALATAYMKGAAWEWWNRLPTKPSTWEELQTGLRDRFQPVNRSEMARVQLRALAQGKRSVHEYVEAFNRLLVHVPTMSEEDRVFQFLQGLRPAIAAQIRMRGEKDLQAVVGLAVRIGSLGDYASSSAFSPHTASSATHARDDPMDLNALLGGVEGLEQETADGAGASGPAPSTSAPVSRAEFDEMLNALKQFRHAGKPHSGGGGPRAPFAAREGPRPLPRIPHLSEAQVREYMAAGKCFNCAKTDHSSRSCPGRKVGPDGKLAWSKQSN